MKVKYEDGPLRRDLPTLGISCERGEAIEVEAEVGKQLIEQGWVKAGGSNGKTSSKTTTEAAS